MRTICAAMFVLLTSACGAAPLQPAIVTPGDPGDTEREWTRLYMVAAGILENDPESSEGRELLLNAIQMAFATRDGSAACAMGRTLVAVASQCRPFEPQPWHERATSLAGLASQYCSSQSEFAGQVAGFLRNCR